jgi:hypothetical protein
MKTSEGNVYGSGANVLNECRREALLERDLDLREGRVVLRQVWADIFPNSAVVNFPRTCPRHCPTASRADSAAASTRRASGRSASPTSFNSTRRVERIKSSVPRCRSRARMDVDNAD